MVAFLKTKIYLWIDFLNDLIESDIFNLTIDLHREALRFCFKELIQGDLDQVKDYWNSHRIRKSKYALIAGVPDMMCFLPEEFGNFSLQVSTEKVQTEMQNILQQKIEDNDETDSNLRSISNTLWRTIAFNTQQCLLRKAFSLKSCFLLLFNRLKIISMFMLTNAH